MLNIVYFNNTHIKSYYSYPIPNTCGMCGNVISKRFDTIAEFTAFENFISFEKKGKNKVKRVENYKINVTIEVDLVFGVVQFNVDIVNEKIRRFGDKT